MPCLLSVLEPQIPIARCFHLIFCGSSLSSGLVLLNTWEWGSRSSQLIPITECVYQAPGLTMEWQKTRVQWLSFSFTLPLHEEGHVFKICALSWNNLWHIAQILLTPSQLMQHWTKHTGHQTSVSCVYGHQIDFKYFSVKHSEVFNLSVQLRLQPSDWAGRGFLNSQSVCARYKPATFGHHVA